MMKANELMIGDWVQIRLGAPIEEFCGIFPTAFIDGIIYDIPTAEQMISWLEEQGISVEITRYDGELRGFEYRLFGIKSCKALFSHRKEATLAAIDAALEY